MIKGPSLEQCVPLLAEQDKLLDSYKSEMTNYQNNFQDNSDFDDQMTVYKNRYKSSEIKRSEMVDGIARRRLLNDKDISPNDKARIIDIINSEAPDLWKLTIRNS